jgi:hypothetical protein
MGTRRGAGPRGGPPVHLIAGHSSIRLARRVAVVALSLGALQIGSIASANAGGQVTLLRGNHASTPLPTWRNTYDWPAGHGYVGMASGSSAADPAAYSFARGLPGAPGAWLWPTGGRRYSPAFAGYSYSAPGTTRILSAVVRLTYPPRLLSHHCVHVFLTDGALERDGKTFCKPPGPPAGEGAVEIALGDPAANPTAKQLALRLELPCAHSNRRACDKNIPVADPRQNGVRFERVDMTLVDDDRPVPMPAGDWFDLRGRYVNGMRRHNLTLAARDAGSGIARVAAEEIGVGELEARRAPCDPRHHTPALGTRICPASFSADVQVDATKLSEGKHTYRETALDVAGNSGASNPWDVYVDRTPPSTATELDAVLNSESGAAHVRWDPAADPPLRDGSPGSGVAGYLVRYRRAGSWSGWQFTPEPRLVIPGSHEGEVLEVEVRSQDAVGNLSPVLAASVTVDAFEPATEEDSGTWEIAIGPDSRSRVGSCTIKGLPGQGGRDDRVSVRVIYRSSLGGSFWSVYRIRFRVTSSNPVTRKNNVNLKATDDAFKDWYWEWNSPDNVVSDGRVYVVQPRRRSGGFLLAKNRRPRVRFQGIFDKGLGADPSCADTIFLN